MLSMALVGFEVEKKRIEEKIAELRAKLGGHSVPAAAASAKKSAVADAPKTRKPLSAAARKRIATAQKKRWAEHRRKLAAAAA